MEVYQSCYLILLSMLIKQYLYIGLVMVDVPVLLLGPVFGLLLGVSSDYAQPITGQVTEVTCPVIGWAQPELTPSKRQKTGQATEVTCPAIGQAQPELAPSKRQKTCPYFAYYADKTISLYRSGHGSKLRLCSANHRPGYWSNLPCDWLSTAWAYPEQETENRPGYWSNLPCDWPSTAWACSEQETENMPIFCLLCW